MERIAPLGPVYQAGTLSGNPLSVAAGLAMLELIKAPGFYDRLERASAALETIFDEAARAAGVPLRVQRVGSMLTPFFQPSKVRNWSEAARSDTKRFARVHRELLAHGVYWPPSQYEAAFVSSAHDDAVLERTRTAVRAALASG
jgi:glutamate-1-semialdehyde 2,1-aminomutase